MSVHALTSDMPPHCGDRRDVPKAETIATPQFRFFRLLNNLVCEREQHVRHREVERPRLAAFGLTVVSNLVGCTIGRSLRTCRSSWVEVSWTASQSYPADLNRVTLGAGGFGYSLTERSYSMTARRVGSASQPFKVAMFRSSCGSASIL